MSQKNCLDCGALLKGRFCHVCGQEHVAIDQAMRTVVADYLLMYWSYDSRMFRTLRALCFQPGELTRAFATGRRTSVTPPVRLIVRLAIVMFLVLKLTGVSIVGFETFTTHGTSGHDLEARDITISVFYLPQPVDGTVSQWLAPKQDSKRGDIDLDDADEITQGELKALLGPLNHSLERPEVTNQYVERWLSLLMLIQIPLLSVLMWVFYHKIESVFLNFFVYAIHMHCFAFMAVASVAMLVWATNGLFDDLFALSMLFVVGLAYTLASLKRLYLQSWPVTLGKWMLLSVSYLVMISCALALAFIYAPYSG